MKKYFILLTIFFLPLFSIKMFSQNVGIGTSMPSEKLEIAGNLKADTLKSNSLKIAVNAGIGKVLTSDANGVAGWQTMAGGLVKAVNGLNKSGDSIKLGGVLFENSAIRINARSLLVSDTGSAISITVSQTSLPLATGLSATALTQTFTCVNNGTLSAIDVYVDAFGGSTISLQVKDGSGVVLGTDINIYPVTFSNWSSFNFSNLLLSAGQQYTLSLTCTGLTQVYYDNNDPYPGGSSSIGTNADIAFKVYSTDDKNLLYLNANRIGIGTLTPEFKLDVRTGSINTDSAYRIGGGTVLSIKGTSNTFVGIGSGNTNTSGSFNSAHGSNALNSNTSGSYNTALGTRALYSNTLGWYNTATGYRGLYSNLGGDNNTAQGYNALLLNLDGNANTAVGSEALFFNGNGSYNTAFGAEALTSTISSNYNTAVGYHAGLNYNLGFNNTIIGAEANGSFSGQFNSIAIGNLAQSTDNSKVRIGNSANWSYEAFANWTNISDGRFKTNIQENVAGLAFIMKLRPVTYKVDAVGLSKKFNEFSEREPDESMKIAIAEKEKMVWTGFIAQEVEAAANETGFEFSGVDKPRNAYGVYGLRYAEFVVPLVKAVQELSIQNEELKIQNEEFKKQSIGQQAQIVELLNRIGKLEAIIILQK